jgi:hypothetical protein
MQPKESKSNKHFIYSIIKSAIRIAAGIALVQGSLWYAGYCLILAEIFGIVEEL